MKEGRYSSQEARRVRLQTGRPWRLKRTASMVLSMLVLGHNSGTEAQTVVGERPTEIPQSVATGGGTERTKSQEDSKKTGPRVMGYIQYHFNQPIDTNNNGAAPSRFRIQRARVTLKGKVNERVSYELDIDPRAPQHAGLMRDAYVDVRLHPHHKLRLGQHKVKFGYVNQRSSSSLYAVNRPKMAFDLSRGINLRDIGATLMGEVPMSGGGVHLEYDLSVVNGAGVNVRQDNNKAKNVSGRIGLLNEQGGSKWQVGVSGAVGDMFRTSTNPIYNGGYFRDFKRVGTDFLLDRSRFAVNGEYAIGKQEEKARSKSKTLAGYYLTLVGKTTETMGPMIRFDGVDGSGRVTAGGYYGVPSAPFRLLLNYEKRSSDDRVYLWLMSRF